MRFLVKLVLAACAFISVGCVSNDTTRTLSLQDARAKYASDVSHFVQLDGIDVHYRAEGSGPALLLIHGTLGDLEDWSGWVDELKGAYRVIRLDLPGFGLSGHIANGNYSIDRMLSLIDALMDHLDEPRFSVAGISYGGIVAFRYAATRVNRTQALLLVNSAGIQSGKKVETAKKAETASKPSATRGRNFMTSPQVYKSDIEQFYAAYINDPAARNPIFIQRKLDFLNIQNRDKAAKQAGALYERGDPIRVLGHVEAPSLVIWGTGNNALDTETAQAFIDAMPNAKERRLVTLRGAGHYINVERPQETGRLARSFFDDVIAR